MYNIIVAVTALLLVASGVHYVRQSYRDEVDPVMSTWILLFAMMTLSLTMYWHKPNKTWGGNIAVTAGFVNLLIILVGVTWVKWRKKTLAVAFTTRQKWCMVAGFVIVPVWMATNNPLMAYVLVQVIGLIAYKGTVDKLTLAVTLANKGERISTEPLTLWVCVLVASMLAIYPAYHNEDVFAWVYLARAVPSTAYVIYLINCARA